MAGTRIEKQVEKEKRYIHKEEGSWSQSNDPELQRQRCT
jgi:hypothetical protein